MATDSGGAGLYLAFQLAHEEYGISILAVREILGMLPITSVPQAPLAVLGVVNLRGKVIPVVDLRTRFGMERVEPTALSCIVVVDIMRDGNQLQYGVVVDQVADVLALDASEIQPPPSFVDGGERRELIGIGLSGGRVLLLLEMDELLADCHATAAAMLA